MDDSQTARRSRLTRAARATQLLDVAEELFIARGYSAVTMEDIARTAGVTRPVVYDHFQTREGVYLACVERARHSFEALLISNLKPGATPRELLTQGGGAFFGLLEDSPARWRLLFGSAAVLPASHADQLEELRFGTIAAIAEVIRAVAPNAPRHTVEAAAHGISGIGERLGRWWLVEPSLTKDEVLEHYLALVWNGVAPLVTPPCDGD